jgi:two-component system response regulator FixJ
MAVKAMKAGALDVIEKPFEDKVLIEATRQVLKKISTINAAEGLDVIRSKIANLSNREREVLKGIVEGLQNKKIAIALNVSPRTVEVHRANVMVKMMARNLPELMKMAVSIGFGAEEAN